MSRWTGRSIVSGAARGPALVSLSPMSFLGDIDIRSGLVVEERSDIAGRSIAGTVLVIPNSRGSAGAWRFIYQLHRHGTDPEAILSEETPDPSVVQGAIMCGIPIVVGVASAIAAARLEPGSRLFVDDGIVSLSG